MSIDIFNKLKDLINSQPEDAKKAWDKYFLKNFLSCFYKVGNSLLIKLESDAKKTGRKPCHWILT